MDALQLMSYQDWENQHKDVTRLARKRIRKERLYFRKQKLFGVGVAIFGLIVSVIADVTLLADVGLVGNVISLFGIYIMVTQRHLIY